VTARTCPHCHAALEPDPVLSRADAYKRALSLSPLAFDALETQLEHGEPREKNDASRVLFKAIGDLAPEDKPGSDQPADPGAQRAALVALMRAPTPMLLDVAREAGMQLVRVRDAEGSEKT